MPKYIPPRATCPVCGRDFNLKANGRLRVHSARSKTVWPSPNCSGSGQPPKTTTDEIKES